jgi:hypothetical protein
LKLESTALLVALTFATAAAAENPPKQAIFLSGTCEQLSLAGLDLTRTCKGALVNILYEDGRSSFMFSDGDRSMVSFSGVGQTTHGDAAFQPVDHIAIAANPGPEVKTEDATGSCEFSNAYKGPAFVRCTAKTQSGDFTAVFKTDGSKPSVTDF